MSSVFNIPNISLSDTFETWYNRTNTIIDDMNSILILDAQAGTSQGLYESYRDGGVVIFGISAGTGLGFSDSGQLTLSFSGVTQGIRTGVNDVLLLINPSDGSVKGVSGTNILPPQVSNDINFTGDISFSGDLNFISSAVVTLPIDASFRDNQLEIAVNFDDSLEFSTVGTSVPLTSEGYFIDTTVVGSDFSGLNTNATSTYIGKGTVLSTDLPGNRITLTDFIFSTSGDSFQEFSNAGATDGSRYVLVSEVGLTYGRGLIDHDGVKAPFARQTAPAIASDAGIVVLTNDPTTPSGGSQGEKLFTWLWNATSADAAWTSSENIEIYSDKSLIARSYMSPLGDRMDFKAQATTLFQTYSYDGATEGFASLYSQPNDTFQIGPFTGGSTFTTSLTFNRDNTLTAGTTGLALNLNADLLDGAHGATLGGSQNLIPITGDDGRIDLSFLPGGGAIEEVISQTAHGLVEGESVRRTSSNTFTGAIATNEGTADAVGIVVEVIDANSFRLRYFGIVSELETSGFSLGLGYGGVTVALNVGDVYYLSDSITGGISDSKPAASGAVVKPMFIALTDKKLLITNYNGRPTPAGDTIDASSLVPVGSVSYVADANITNNSDFLVCDGKVYDNTAYPDLKTSVQGRFYLEGIATGGESSFKIYGENAELRNFEAGQTFQLSYNEDATVLGITVASISSATDGVQVHTTTTLSGSGFFDDVKVRGTGAYFVVPDLRSRGVVGTGDPDGDLTEDDLAAGDVVGFGGGAVFDNIFDSGDIRSQAVTKWRVPVENGTYHVTVTFDTENSPALAEILNDAEVVLDSQASGGFDGSDRATYTFLVYSSDGALKIRMGTGSGNKLFRLSGWRISEDDITSTFITGATY